MSDIHSYEPLWKHWVLDEQIGTGNYGSAWKAHRENEYSAAEQYACVKHISIPNENMLEDVAGFSLDALKDHYADQLARLVKEIEAMIELRGKPHIVSYEEHLICSKPAGLGYDLFVRMELLTSLQRHVDLHGAPGPDEIVKLAFHMAKAIAVLESHSIIHRDIKPSNIFVDPDGDYKLGDFGTARVLSQNGSASTRTGTPGYMAPEVYSLSSSYDQTVDLYSLGIVLYYYLNDRALPFERETSKPDAALSRRINGEALPKPLRADDQLAAIVLKLCAFDPADRYQTASELLHDLEGYRIRRRKATVTADPAPSNGPTAVKPPHPPMPGKPVMSRPAPVPPRPIQPPSAPPKPPIQQYPPVVGTPPASKTAVAQKNKGNTGLRIVLILLVVLLIAVIAVAVVLTITQQGETTEKTAALLTEGTPVFREALKRIL